MADVDVIADVLSRVSSVGHMRKFCSELFTPAEIQDVALRWRLMEMLHEGIPQRQIAEKLGISLCKITRGSRILKSRQSVAKKILDSKGDQNHASRQKTKPSARPARVLR